MRKGESEYKIPNKFDIRGASEIADQVDNIFIIHRNREKEDNNGDKDEPDCILKVAKQRHFSWEGKFSLWFHKESGQYTGDPNRIMNHWINQ